MKKKSLIEILHHMVTIDLVILISMQTWGYFDPKWRKSLVASGDLTAVHSKIKSFVPRLLCCWIKKRNPKQISERALSMVKPLVLHSFPFCLGSSDWVHSSCTLSIERSDLLACQGKHCSRKQSKSTYLAPLKWLLFSLANLCNSHAESGKEFDEAYNDD